MIQKIKPRSVFNQSIAAHPAVAEIVAIAAITLLGGALRFYRLGAWSFWIDELYTLQIASGFPYHLTNDFLFAIREHPFTSVLIYTAVSTLGSNEWTARLMPAFIGIVSIPLLYFINKKIFNAPIALLAALFLAVSPWHIFWSQNARFYTALLLFFWLALMFFYWGIRNRQKNNLLVSALFFILAVGERLLGLFLIPTAALVVLYFVWRRKNIRMITQYTPALLVAGMVAVLIFGVNFLLDPQLWRTIYMIPPTLSPFGLLTRYVQAVDVHIVLFGALGMLYLYQQRNDFLVVLAAAIVVPLGITMLFSLFQFTHPRYTFVSLPAWLTLAGVGVYETLRSLRPSSLRPLQIALLVLALLVVPFTELKDYATVFGGGRNEWRDAFLFVDQHATEEDWLFTNDPVVAAYYLDQLEPLSMRELPPQSVAVRQCDFGETVWFVVGGTGRADYQFEKWVRETAVPVEINAYKVRLYRLNRQTCIPG